MIKVSVMYPQQEGSNFNLEYYLKNHMDLVKEKWGPMGMKDFYVTKGLAGGAPDQPPTYQIMAHLSFESMDALQNAMGTHGEEVMADIPNFTDVTPVVQIGEVLT